MSLAITLFAYGCVITAALAVITIAYCGVCCIIGVDK